WLVSVACQRVRAFAELQIVQSQGIRAGTPNQAGSECCCPSASSAAAHSAASFNEALQLTGFSVAALPLAPAAECRYVGGRGNHGTATRDDLRQGHEADDGFLPTRTWPLRDIRDAPG